MSCEDIPSLLDLQKVKKHADDFGRLMGTGTGTSTNGVTGQVRPTYNAVMANLGYTRVGTFASGGTLTNGRQTLLWDIADGGDGQEYGWSGSFLPSGKVVPPGSTPLTTGGIAVGAWMSRFDPELRTQVLEALRRSYAEAGYKLINGSFEAGGTLTNPREVLIQESTGKAYAWEGSYPLGVYVVPPNSTPVGVSWVDKSDRIGLLFNVNDFGAVGDGVTDDTIAIIKAMTEVAKRGGTLIFNGEYVYNTATAGGMRTFSLAGRNVNIRGNGRAVVKVNGAGIAWAINCNSQVSSPEFDGVTFINMDNVSLMCTFNVTYGTNIWGASAKFHKVVVRYFKDAQLEFNQAFNCSFTRCEFNGADGQTYQKGIRLPAVDGATSSCIRVTGGKPAWSGVISISNLFYFRQCIFQNAKYGVDSYYMDQSTFASCTFQYLWIGIKLAIDGVNGDYSSSKIVLNGVNYAEWIANRFIADVPILDDGVTEGTYVARGNISSGDRQFVHPASYQGAPIQMYSDSVKLSRFVREGVPSPTTEYITASIYNPDTEVQTTLFRVDSAGAVYTAKGYSFSDTPLPDPGESTTRALKNYKYNYTLGASPDAELTGISGPTKESIVQTVGHITTCSFKLSGILTGTGPIEIALARQAITVTSISLMQCGVASTTAIFGRIKLGSGGMAISLYKDPTMLTPLQASDLHTGVYTVVSIGISFIQ